MGNFYQIRNTLQYLWVRVRVIAFESSLRYTSYVEWSIDWHFQVLDPKLYPVAAFPQNELRILVGVEHMDKYGWGISKSIKMTLHPVSVELAF